MDTIESLRAEVAKLKEQKARLVEALRPIKHQVRIIDEAANADHMPAYPDCSLFTFRGSYTALSLGDLRRIAQVVRECDEGEQPK